MLKVISLPGFLLLFSITCLAQKADEKAVRSSFQKYKEAISEKNGKEAIQYVSDKTIKYYDEVLVWVKTADSMKLESLTLLDKMMVLVMRHRSTKEQLLSFNGTSLFIYA